MLSSMTLQGRFSETPRPQIRPAEGNGCQGGPWHPCQCIPATEQSASQNHTLHAMVSSLTTTPHVTKAKTSTALPLPEIHLACSPPNHWWILRNYTELCKCPLAWPWSPHGEGSVHTGLMNALDFTAALRNSKVPLRISHTFLLLLDWAVKNKE